MYFASPPPWWLAALAAAAIVGTAVFSYWRTLVPLGRAQRGALIALRILAPGLIVLLLCRPVVLRPPSDVDQPVVPILVDVSRSMRVADSDGRSRADRAVELVKQELLPALGEEFVPEVYAFGERVVPEAPDRLRADARRTDLLGAIDTIRTRYRGRAIPGVIVISDGADTGEGGRAKDQAGPPLPVYTLGVGSREGPPDREILALSAGEPRLEGASIDLRVSAVSHGFGGEPFEVRIAANGAVIDSRWVSPAVDGSPVDEVFTVSPDPATPTVYTAEIEPAAGEVVVENNTRQVLVSPAGRRRRVLLLAGAPAFEHAFLLRALTVDPGLEVDAVVRKGKNDAGQDTFLVQAAGGRSSALAGGIPSSREALYAYDAIFIANLESDFFTRAQLAQMAEFVAARGGGLLVMGGRSFAQRGLTGTPLEAVLPVEPNDRRGSLRRLSGERAGAPNTVSLTAEGERHPVMRIAASGGALARHWAGMPPLAAVAPLGGPRPGATVLAVSAAHNGVVYPLVAVQRYGAGRSMVFAGEASWRWRMLRPAADRSFEFFWRQAARWLAAEAPDPVAIDAPELAEPGDPIELVVRARDASFEPIADASVDATLTAPGGAVLALTPRRTGDAGRFASAIRADESGLYHVRADVRRGETLVGSAERWFYVGGADRELAEPRLNEPLLQRVAAASGGSYFPASEAAGLVSALRAEAPATLQQQPQDIWHRPWLFAAVLGLMAGEWVLRRRWGLR